MHPNGCLQFNVMLGSILLVMQHRGFSNGEMQCNFIQNLKIHPKCSLIFYFQMFDWIFSNKESFLVNYVDIGHSYTTAKKLQDEHSVRTHNSNVSCYHFFIICNHFLIVVRIYVTYHFSDGLRECHSYFTRSLPNPRKWSLRRKSRAIRSYSFRTNVERFGIYF